MTGFPWPLRFYPCLESSFPLSLSTRRPPFFVEDPIVPFGGPFVNPPFAPHSPLALVSGGRSVEEKSG